MYYTQPNEIEFAQHQRIIRQYTLLEQQALGYKTTLTDIANDIVREERIQRAAIRLEKARRGVTHS